MPTMFTALGSLVTTIWAVLRLRTLLLAVVTFLFLADYLKRRHPKNFPPGPRCLPFIGNLLQLDMGQPHMGIHQHVKKYGNVISLDFGIKSSVIVTSLPLIKEAFTHLEENFMSRPQFPLQNLVFNKNGLVFSSGQTWKEQRRFALMTLRNFGLGKKSLEQCIQEEARHLVEVIKEEKGQPFDPHFKINNAVSKIICSITFGERFEYHDSQFQELLRLLNEATSLTSSKMVRFSHIFSVRNLGNVFFSYEAEKVQAEIDRVIGQEKQPSLNDRDAMPYTNAVVHEVQRMANIVPLNVPREVTVDTTLAGFHLPKGSMLQTNLTALHRDPNEWATPDVFNPEHFLENGEFRKRESFLPFSMGKRACLGEQLARSELFIFFTALVQKFTFKPPVNEKLSLKSRLGVPISTVSHHLCAVPRL
ncbi:cytochrome P450 2J4-like [Alexandromys fortis]|uniref:cytochrome P450 2J4-like n=1 Tax=Alexandromys fortis TaxID=100897 RepID=UPI0021522AAC|nr:cytochrome P450 2J4-like [Microtus fortis]